MPIFGPNRQIHLPTLIPDSRNAWCSEINYNKRLPTASTQIIIHIPEILGFRTFSTPDHAPICNWTTIQNIKHSRYPNTKPFKVTPRSMIPLFHVKQYAANIIVYDPRVFLSTRNTALVEKTSRQGSTVLVHDRVTRSPPTFSQIGVSLYAHK